MPITLNEKLSFKKAFSLIELLISIFLISLMYGLYFYENKKEIKFNANTIKLATLKEDLLRSYPFKNTLRVVCLKRDIQCFVIIDNNKKKNRPINLFDEVPDVYEYGFEFNLKMSTEIIFDNDEFEEVFFDFSINKDFKTNEMIIFYKDFFYIYNSFNFQILIIKEREEVVEMFQNRYAKVKNAFSI